MKMKIIINLGREILLLGSVRESIMTPSETSSEKKNVFLIVTQSVDILARITTPLLNLIMTLITLVTNSSFSGRL
jgi:hypothetical protein